MKITVLFSCVVLGAGIIIASQYFQYLIEPIKWILYISAFLFFALLFFAKKLKFTDNSMHVLIVPKLSSIEYLGTIIGIQLLFYIFTGWIFSCYVYQTNVNPYLHRVCINELITIFQEHTYTYTFLPFLASACCGIGLLYFVTKYKKSPFLVECFFHQPKKLPGLFFHNILVAAEAYSSIIIMYVVFMFLLLIINNALSLLTTNFSPLTDPFLYLMIILPVFLLFNPYGKDLIGLSIRKKYSLGLMFILMLIVFLVALTLIVIFFQPVLKLLAWKNNDNYVLLNTTFDQLSNTRVEILLLSWFFVNMPRLGNIIGKFSYGFTIRRALVLNLIATGIVGGVIQFVFLAHWHKVYNLFVDPFWLFYSSLFALFSLWLYASYIRDKSTLWAGPMCIFPTLHFKNRSIIKFTQRSFFVLLVMLGGAGFIGWRLSQYLITFIAIFLLPIYVCFSGKLLQYLVKELIATKGKYFGICPPRPACGRMNTLLQIILEK